MPQAVVILTPHSAHSLIGAFAMSTVPSHVVLDFPSCEEREDFCTGNQVFWYQYVEDMDFGESGSVIGRPRQQNVGVRERYGRWCKGGAWEALEAEQKHEAEAIEKDERGDIW
jgi:hypothetical protein